MHGPLVDQAGTCRFQAGARGSLKCPFWDPGMWYKSGASSLPKDATLWLSTLGLFSPAFKGAFAYTQIAQRGYVMSTERAICGADDLSNSNNISEAFSRRVLPNH